MKEKLGKVGYYIGAGIGSIIAAWSIFKIATGKNECKECECCEDACEECKDEETATE